VLDLVDAPGGERLVDREKERLLAGEVGIQRPCRHSGGGRDLLHPRARVAVTSEDPRGRVQQGPPSAGLAFRAWDRLAARRARLTHIVDSIA
jgi:hypothetical protein